MSDNTSSHFLDRFEELGLSRNEASVYLALLKNYPVTGYKLAKDSGILRPIVYEMLTRLVEKGGVKIVKDSPEQYSPISPENFLTTLEKRFTDAKSSLSVSLAFFKIKIQIMMIFGIYLIKIQLLQIFKILLLKQKKKFFFILIMKLMLYF